MTDDGFDFDDDDETTLFGTSSDESSVETATETDQRFGTTTTDDSSQSLIERVRTVASGDIIRTATTVALAAGLVVVLVAGAYPLVMGAIDTGGSADDRAPNDSGSAGVSTPTTSTDPSVTEIVVTVAPPTAAERATTERSTVVVKEFPAGEPADGNETADGA